MKNSLRLITLVLVLALLIPNFALASTGEEDVTKLDVERIEGSDRYATANAIAASVYPTADKVILASGGKENYPDALAGSALAGSLEAPILLTNNLVLDSDTLELIKDLGPSEVIVLGGDKAVSDDILALLKDENLQVRRISGKDRYETAEKIAREVDNKFSHAFIALGTSFPDALSIGPVAARDRSPVILTSGNKMLDSTLETLKELGITSVTIIGGDKAVSKDVENQVKEVVPSVKRVAGDDRYETSTKIAEEFFEDNDEVLMASGLDFPDALAGSYLGAYRNAPILLVDPNTTPKSTEDYVKDKKISKVTILGGDKAVSEEVKEEIETINKPDKTEPDPKPDPDPSPDPDPDPDPEIKPDPDPDPDPEIKPDPDPDYQVNLRALYDKMGELNEITWNDYMRDSLRKYFRAFGEAERITQTINRYGRYNVFNQSDVDKALENLTYALDNLEDFKPDKNLLADLIEMVEKEDGSKYYEDYWNEFMDIVEDAKDVYEDETADISKIDRAAASIYVYADNYLQFNDDNKDQLLLLPLEMDIKEAEHLLTKKDDYTENSLIELGKVLNLVKEESKGPKVSQEQIDDLITDIENSKKKLEDLADAFVIEMQIYQAQTLLDYGGLNDEETREVEDAVKDAEKVLNDKNLAGKDGNDQVEYHHRLLENLVDSLQPIDLEQLEYFIERGKNTLVEKDAPEKDKIRLDKAIEAAETAMTNQNLTRKEYHAIFQELLNATHTFGGKEENVET